MIPSAVAAVPEFFRTIATDAFCNLPDELGRGVAIDRAAQCGFTGAFPEVLYTTRYRPVDGVILTAVHEEQMVYRYLRLQGQGGVIRSDVRAQLAPGAGYPDLVLACPRLLDTYPFLIVPSEGAHYGAVSSGRPAPRSRAYSDANVWLRWIPHRLARERSEAA